MSESKPLTLLLRSGETGRAELLERIYDELRKIARARMGRERSDHTLQATALVHEAWLRLAGDSRIAWRDRGHFFAAASEAMRRILVDHARRRARQKRGGGAERDAVTVDGLPGPAPSAFDAAMFLALDEAITQLEQDDPRAGAVVRLRYFGGLSVDETAEALGLARLQRPHEALDGVVAMREAVRLDQVLVDADGVAPELDLRLGWRVTGQLELSLVGQNLLHDDHAEFGPPEQAGRLERSAYIKAALHL